MTDDNIFNAHFSEHLSGDLTGKCAGFCPVAVFCTNMHVGTFAQGKCGFKVCIWNTQNNFTSSIFYQRIQLGDQFFCSVAVVVHFPVSSNNCFAECFIHNNNFLSK